MYIKFYYDCRKLKNVEMNIPMIESKWCRRCKNNNGNPVCNYCYISYDYELANLRVDITDIQPSEYLEKEKMNKERQVNRMIKAEEEYKHHFCEYCKNKNQFDNEYGICKKKCIYDDILICPTEWSPEDNYLMYRWPAKVAHQADLIIQTRKLHQEPSEEEKGKTMDKETVFREKTMDKELEQEGSKFEWFCEHCGITDPKKCNECTYYPTEGVTLNTPSNFYPKGMSEPLSKSIPSKYSYDSSHLYTLYGKYCREFPDHLTVGEFGLPSICPDELCDCAPVHISCGKDNPEDCNECINCWAGFGYDFPEKVKSWSEARIESVCMAIEDGLMSPISGKNYIMSIMEEYKEAK